MIQKQSTLEDCKQVDYVPHGINDTVFKPIDNVPEDFKKNLLGGKDYKFVLILDEQKH